MKDLRKSLTFGYIFFRLFSVYRPSDFKCLQKSNVVTFPRFSPDVLKFVVLSDSAGNISKR